MKSINKNLNETIDNRLQDSNITNDKIDEIIDKTINKKSKINKSNKELTKLINDKVMNSINKNLNDIIDNKIEGINIPNEMIDDKVTKVKNKKKERKIDEKLKEDVKYVFDNFMNNQKIINYDLIDKRIKEFEKMYDKRSYNIEEIIKPNENNIITSDDDEENNNIPNEENEENVNSEQIIKLYKLQEKFEKNK